MADNGEVLTKAHDIINGQRQSDYGTPQECYMPIAKMWSAYLGIDVSVKDVFLLMSLLKIGREKSKHKPDNLLDACGYTALADDAEKIV